jgi:hypothetical protein
MHRAPVQVVTNLTHADSIALTQARQETAIANARSAELSRQLVIARKEGAVQRIEYTPLEASALALANRAIRQPRPRATAPASLASVTQARPDTGSHETPTGARDTSTMAAASTPDSATLDSTTLGPVDPYQLAIACKAALLQADVVIAGYERTDSLNEERHRLDQDALAHQITVDSIEVTGLRRQLAAATGSPSRLERAWGKVRTPLTFLAGLYIGAKAGIAVARTAR